MITGKDIGNYIRDHSDLFCFVKLESFERINKMITGKDIGNYIRDHSVLSYNFEKDELEQMISAEDAWKLVLMVTHSICEEIKVPSNAESGTLSEPNRSSEKDA